MTNDERKKLIHQLRILASDQISWRHIAEACCSAADELARLAAENADMTALADKLCEKVIVLKQERAELRKKSALTRRMND